MQLRKVYTPPGRPPRGPTVQRPAPCGPGAPGELKGKEGGSTSALEIFVPKKWPLLSLFPGLSLPYFLIPKHSLEVLHYIFSRQCRQPINLFLILSRHSRPLRDRFY